MPIEKSTIWQIINKIKEIHTTAKVAAVLLNTGAKEEEVEKIITQIMQKDIETLKKLVTVKEQK